MRWPRVKLVFLGTAAALLLTCAIAFGGTVPNTLNYQGSLYDGTGQPVTGTKDITVSLYDVASGGIPLWSEKQAGVIVKNGNFSLVLGKSDQNPLKQSRLIGETYIGITVGTDNEMVPRQQFSSVAYALKSGDGIPVGGIIMWSGAISQVPPGWALCDGANGTPNLQDRFIVGAGNGYSVGSIGGSAFINLQHNHNGTTGGTTATRKIDDGNDHSVTNNDHTHNFSTDYQLSTAQDIRPPFYALAFIMKLQ